MPSEWIDKPKEAGWLKTAEPIIPTIPPPPPPAGADKDLKTLPSITDDRQKASEDGTLVKKEPTPLPEPLETIPYSKVATGLVSASTDALEAFSKLTKASATLGKGDIEVPSEGPKGSELRKKLTEFRSKLDSLGMEAKKISEEMAAYKNSLPKETATPPQI